MRLTQEMINNSFKLINEIYGYGNSEKDILINYNPYVASWFAGAMERLYNIKIHHIPTKEQFQNWKIQTERKDKLIKLCH